MSLLDFGSDLVSAALGVAAGYSLARWRRRGPNPKTTCPWFGCGYPMSEAPLVARFEEDHTYGGKRAVIAAEECEGCRRLVIWSTVHGRYVRWFKAGGTP